MITYRRNKIIRRANEILELDAEFQKILLQQHSECGDSIFVRAGLKKISKAAIARAKEEFKYLI